MKLYLESNSFTNWVLFFDFDFEFNLNSINKVQNVFFIIAAIVFLMGAIQQYFVGGDWYHTNLLLMGNLLTKISSIPIAFYFFSRLPKTSVFDYFVKYGKYSLIIYLIHAPVTSIVRVILLRVGLSNYFVLMVGITVITWYVSVFVCWLSQKISLIDMVFSPYKYIAQRKVPA